MITVRKSKGRHFERHRKLEVWLTFYPRNRADPFAEGFGTLEFLNEERLPPGADAKIHLPHDAEVVSYVHEGAIEYEDPKGRWNVIQAGEFQRISGGRGRVERNASKTDWAHIFRIHLRPLEAGRESICEQKRFSMAERRGRLFAVASPDTRGGSLRIRQNTLMYSAVLDPGQHVVHELSPGRSAWIHVVNGEIRLGDIVLARGDGAGVTAESAVSLTALEKSSILLFDVGDRNTPASSVMPGYPLEENLSGAALFRILWDALVDVLGPAATAAIVNRSARRAQVRRPELAELGITRVHGEFEYVLPPSFDKAAGGLAPLRDLLDEIQAPLVDLTGQVVLRHLERIPELREWATHPGGTRRVG
jgi:redox-sensitive bicupin YhaK (pirin superfamily)